MLKNICTVLMMLIGILFAYRTLFSIVGLFWTKKFPKAKKFHRYGVVIAARNEEAVIGKLIDSINKQDYPTDKLKVFVVADNCTDRTAEIARAHGAVCYERTDLEHCTKGFALNFLFRRIEKDYGITAFDGYFVFDADNLLKQDFVSRMNDAFDAGEKIITSYRNTKNFDTNCVAAGYALHWMRTARLESRGRSALNFTTRLQGTGYLVSSELLKDGWNWTSLTEDREFSAIAVCNGVRITYQHEAEFYDEQPVSFKIAWRQRLRWAKGNLWVFTHCFSVLSQGMVKGKELFRKLACFDMHLTNLPYCMVMVPLKLISALLVVFVSPGEAVWWEIATEIIGILILEHFGVIPFGIVLFITERKRIPTMPLWKKLLYILSFPLFGMVGDAAMWAASLTDVTWKPIPHKVEVNIEQVESTIGKR